MPHEENVSYFGDPLLNFTASHDGNCHVLCLQNVSGQTQALQLHPGTLNLSPGIWQDLLSGATYPAGMDGLALSLPPYAVCWLKA